MRKPGLPVFLIATFGVFVCLEAATAQEPPDPDRFCAGLYANELRFGDCVRGPSGSGFDLYLWLWVPSGPGLNYVTLRFDFPDILELSGRPDLHELSIDLIIVDYIDGTVEWTVLFEQCPGGWTAVFRQRCILLDGAASQVRIVEAPSLARHCDFVLEGLLVMNSFSVNDPACPFTDTGSAAWGTIKSLCRQRHRP